MQNSSPAISEQNVPASLESARDLAAWFDAAPSNERSARRPTAPPPPPVSVVGEFLGDELADGWLR